MPRYAVSCYKPFQDFALRVFGIVFYTKLTVDQILEKLSSSLDVRKLDKPNYAPLSINITIISVVPAHGESQQTSDSFYQVLGF